MQLSRVPSGLPPLVQCLSGWEPLSQQIPLYCVAPIVEGWLARSCRVLIRGKNRGMSSRQVPYRDRAMCIRRARCNEKPGWAWALQTLGLCGHEVP